MVTNIGTKQEVMGGKTCLYVRWAQLVLWCFSITVIMMLTSQSIAFFHTLTNILYLKAHRVEFHRIQSMLG